MRPKQSSYTGLNQSRVRKNPVVNPDPGHPVTTDLRLRRTESRLNRSTRRIDTQTNRCLKGRSKVWNGTVPVRHDALRLLPRPPDRLASSRYTLLAQSRLD